MIEKLIEITEIQPSDLFGVNNKFLQIVQDYFPKLKIVARDAQIKVFGESEIIEEFERRLQMLIHHFNRFHSLDQNSVERLLMHNSTQEWEQELFNDDVIVYGVGGKHIKARTKHQQEMVKLLKKNDMLFAIGPAGTGKTYTAVALAVKALKDKEVKRIILTRPAVEAGENLGFLPGDLKEKLDPYMQPLYDALRDMIPYEKLQSYFEKGVIQIAPLAFMRGRTLNECFVILDEAQNTTHMQMKMFLTRMGEHAKFVITGDPGQIDLPKKQNSGLKEAILILANVPGIAILQLDERDNMRHRLVKKIISAYKTIEENRN